MKFLTIDGHLGKDAEQMVTPKNTEFISFSLANDTYIKGAIKTVWYNVVVFNVDAIRSRLAYLKKGAYVAVTGIPDETPYVTKDGRSLRIDYSLFADRIEFLGGNKKNGENDSQKITEQQANTSFVAPINALTANVPQPQVTYQQPIPQATYQPPIQQPMSQPTYQQPAPQVIPTVVPGSDTGEELPF